jgi:ABC-2 type transport system ATP-binding protein
MVEARDLTREFDGVAVVKSLDLTIDEGSIVGLIGPSGCGKTTTVRLLTGLLRPTSGEARLGGVPATRLGTERRRHIGYLPQIPALFPDLSLWENLSFHASMYGLPLRRRARLREMLEWVELEGDRHKKVSQVSGGMQRRLALAASLVHDPMFVFLDEPTAGIDPILREKFWEHFRALGDTGKTMVVTTQYVGEAAYCDYVGLLSDGELLMVDTPANLRRAAFEGEVVDITTRRPVTDGELAQLEQLPFVVGSVEREGPAMVRVVIDGTDDGEMQVLNERLGAMALEVESIEEHFVDYDEAFVRIVERHRSVAESAESDQESDQIVERRRPRHRAVDEHDEHDEHDVLGDDGVPDTGRPEWPPPPADAPPAPTATATDREEPRHVDA